jgi:hypothetical protein
MSASDAPPPVLDGARVLAYAILDASVQWTGRQKVLMGDKEVGPVPRLALCQNVGGDLRDILIFHCNEQWDVLGCSGGATLDAAKASAERAYRGVTAKWIETNVSEDAAAAWMRKQNYPDLSCSFCGRQPNAYRRLVEGPSGGRICNHCIDAYYAAIRQPGGGDQN